MQDVIATLEAQHREIASRLEKIRSSVFNKAATVQELRAVKSLIIEHLTLEDKTIYAQMKQRPETAELAKQFGDKMLPISEAVLAFFAKYDINSGEVGMDFFKDLGRLLQTLGHRIQQEETRLYPAYQAMATKSAHRPA